MTLEDLRAPIEEEERLDRVLDRLVNDARILIGKLRKSAEAEGAVVRVVAPAGGVLKKNSTKEIVERILPSTRSVEYDALVIADGTTSHQAAHQRSAGDGRPPPCMGTRGAGHGSVTREVTLSSP
jgi:hypothetical protein